MEFSSRKLMLIALAALLTFVFVAGLLLQFLPGPREQKDYMVAGAAATLAALAVCFAAVFTDDKARSIFLPKETRKTESAPSASDGPGDRKADPLAHKKHDGEK